MSKKILGIDPGGRYVGASLIDAETKEVLFSSCYKRPEDMPPMTWAVTIAQRVYKDIDEICGVDNVEMIGVETVVPPQAYFKGKKTMLPPAFFINVSFCAGTFAAIFPNVTMIRPKNNGSAPLENYPKEITGRRSKTLPGVGEGPRDHERSAYDVALKTEMAVREGWVLDSRDENPTETAP